MRNIYPSLILLKPGIPRPGLPRTEGVECEIAALEFLQSWCRARERLAAQRRRSDGPAAIEEKTRNPDTATMFLQSRAGCL